MCVCACVCMRVFVGEGGYGYFLELHSSYGKYNDLILYPYSLNNGPFFVFKLQYNLIAGME